VLNRPTQFIYSKYIRSKLSAIHILLLLRSQQWVGGVVDENIFLRVTTLNTSFLHFELILSTTISIIYYR
jgi:hypothetical protein